MMTLCLHIRQHLFDECIDMSNGAYVRSYEWGGCGSFAEAEQPVLRNIVCMKKGGNENGSRIYGKNRSIG